MNLKLKIAAASLMALLGMGQAQAVLMTPVSSNAYISQNGLDWAWGNPVQGADLSYQAQFGWRLPTLAELAMAPLATDFLFNGANAGMNLPDPVSGSYFVYDPLGSFRGMGACAAAWFSNSGYLHCDWGNGLGQEPGNNGWAGAPGAQSHYEQLLVRASQVPEPGSLALLSLSLVGLALSRKKA